MGEAPRWITGMVDAKINQLIQAEDEALDVYMAFGLLWIAAADGALNRAAHAYLYRHHKSLPRALDRADKLLAIIADNDLRSFLIACRGLQRGLSADDKKTFLNDAIATAVADGKLSLAANHTLRFMADLLDYTQEELAAAYNQQADDDLPELGDPGSPHWWKRKKAEQKREKEDEGFDMPLDLPVHRSEAFAVLGLTRTASSQEVKQAYRRLVQSHHPDRVAALEQGARKAAETKFIQVQQAYEMLRK